MKEKEEKKPKKDKKALEMRSYEVLIPLKNAHTHTQFKCGTDPKSLQGKEGEGLRA